MRSSSNQRQSLKASSSATKQASKPALNKSPLNLSNRAANKTATHSIGVIKDKQVLVKNRVELCRDMLQGSRDIGWEPAGRKGSLRWVLSSKSQVEMER